MEIDRDVVVRMNPNLSDDQIDELIDQRVPELTFEYEGSVRMSTAVYKQYKAVARNLDQYRKYVQIIEAFAKENFKLFAETPRQKVEITDAIVLQIPMTQNLSATLRNPVHTRKPS